MRARTRMTPRELALHLLSRSAYSVQMAAVISNRRGRILGFGWNHQNLNGGVHAEEHALRRAKRAKQTLIDATITIAGRRWKSKNFVFSRPCALVCLPLIAGRGLKKIEYLVPGNHPQTGYWEIEYLY